MLRQVLDRTNGSRVLEIGCGTEPILRAAVGVDIDACALRSARRAGFVHVVVGDVFTLPFRSAAFGAIVASGLLHHLLDWKAALGEIARALRPHGHLLVLDMAPLSQDDYVEMNRQLAIGGGAPESRNGVSEDELDAVLGACGLERVRSEPAGCWSSATPRGRSGCSPANLGYTTPSADVEARGTSVAAL